MMDIVERKGNPEKRERILKRKEAEDSARKLVAKECGSNTTAEEYNKEKYNTAVKRYHSAIDRGSDNLYVTATEYGMLLSYLRKKKGFSVTEISEKLHVPEPAVEQFESAYTTPGPTERKQLERLLGLSERFDSVRITDEARDYIYGTRNYAPFLFDMAYGMRENSKRLMKDLRFTRIFLYLTIVMSAVAALFALCATLVPDMKNAGYISASFAVASVICAILALISHKQTISRQNRVKKASFQVIEALYENGRDPEE